MLSVGFINQQFKEKGKCLIWYEYYTLQVLEKFSPKDIKISRWVKNRKAEISAADFATTCTLLIQDACQ